MSTNIKSCSKFMFVTFMSTIQNHVILLYHSSFLWPSNFLQSTYINFILIHFFHQFIHCSWSVQSAYIPSCYPHFSNLFFHCLGQFHSVWLFQGQNLGFLTVNFFTVTGCQPVTNPRCREAQQYPHALGTHFGHLYDMHGLQWDFSFPWSLHGELCNVYHHTKIVRILS